jgi:hypothetical protein
MSKNTEFETSDIKQPEEEAPDSSGRKAGWKGVRGFPKAIFIGVTVYILFILMADLLLPSLSSSRWGLLLLIPGLIFLAAGALFLHRKG